MLCHLKSDFVILSLVMSGYVRLDRISSG